MTKFVVIRNCVVRFFRKETEHFEMPDVCVTQSLGDRVGLHGRKVLLPAPFCTLWQTCLMRVCFSDFVQTGTMTECKPRVSRPTSWYNMQRIQDDGFVLSKLLNLVTYLTRPTDADVWTSSIPTTGPRWQRWVHRRYTQGFRLFFLTSLLGMHTCGWSQYGGSLYSIVTFADNGLEAQETGTAAVSPVVQQS